MGLYRFWPVLHVGSSEGQESSMMVTLVNVILLEICESASVSWQVKAWESKEKGYTCVSTRENEVKKPVTEQKRNLTEYQAMIPNSVANSWPMWFLTKGITLSISLCKTSIANLETANYILFCKWSWKVFPAERRNSNCLHLTILNGRARDFLPPNRKCSRASFFGISTIKKLYCLAVKPASFSAYDCTAPQKLSWFISPLTGFVSSLQTRWVTKRLALNVHDRPDDVFVGYQFRQVVPSCREVQHLTVLVLQYVRGNVHLEM